MKESNTPRCPICKRPVDFAQSHYRPFCSKRCKMIDLGSWFKEDYRIMGEDLDSELVYNPASNQDREG